MTSVAVTGGTGVVKIAHSTTAGNVPSSLVAGQLSVNHADRKLFAMGASGAVEDVLGQWAGESPVVAAIVSSGTATFTLSNAQVQTLTVTGATTIALSGWKPGYSQFTLEITNGGSAALTWPTANWITSTGAVQSTPTRTLQSSGVDWVVLWSPDGGTTVYARFI